MENNFDKIFKDKLEHREFEMKPEYWAGAEALIEADEKSGFWRKFFILFGAVLIVGLGWFILNQNNDTAAIAGVEKTSNSKVGNVLLEDNKNTKSNEEINDDLGNTRDASIENKDNSLNRNSVENNSVNELLQKSLNANNDLKNNTNSKNAQEVGNTTFSKDNISTSNTVSKANGNEKVDNQIISDNSGRNNSITNVMTDSENNNNNVITKADQSENKEVLNPLIPEEITSENDKSAKEEITIKPIASNSAILIPFLDLFLNSKKLEKLDLETVTQFEFPRPNFSYGITAGAIGYPLIENSSTQPFFGFKGGILLERNFKIKKAKMSFGGEFLYHLRSGNFVSTKQNDFVNYSFGRSIAQAKLIPKKLHYLELPLLLKYQKNRLSLEAGASFNYLLGVKGTVTQVDGTEESGWVSNLGFRRNHVNVLLGAHFRIGNNRYFGVRADYSPNGILDKNAVLPNGNALQDSGPLYLTFKLTQYLKFKK